MTIRVSLPPAVVEQLHELAGGERHKSEYLTEMIPVLYRATQRAKIERIKHKLMMMEEVLTEILDEDA